MADRDKQGPSGRDLQASQSGGESGEFGGNMEQQQAGGRLGDAGDLSSVGGGEAPRRAAGEGLSRGEIFDEQQGGGRGPESVSDDDGQDSADEAETESE